MNDHIHPEQDIKDIRQMMERSSRFISLSGLSGVSAGICALIGAGFACSYISADKIVFNNNSSIVWAPFFSIPNTPLVRIAGLTFVSAFITALLFTGIKSKKKGVPMWGIAAKRVIINVFVPMVAGGFFILKLMQISSYALIAPACLIFYGLALINTGKYTLEEIRYLGYTELALGILNLCFIGYGLYFWAFGFGVLHIIYGLYMWNKYDRKKPEDHYA